MADKEQDQQNETEESQAESEESTKEQGVPQKKNILKISLLIGLPLLLLGGGAAVFFLTDIGHSLLHKKESQEKKVSPHELVFFPLPELLVNLNSADKKKPSFLRLVVKFEVQNADDAKNLELLQPRIIDQFQVYLRELRIEDLQGSSGMQRLREELLKRVNTVAAPIKVKDVLFETMLVQ
jgi:flagellar FliL protein